MFLRIWGISETLIKPIYRNYKYNESKNDLPLHHKFRYNYQKALYLIESLYSDGLGFRRVECSNTIIKSMCPTQRVKNNYTTR